MLEYKFLEKETFACFVYCSPQHPEQNTALNTYLLKKWMNGDLELSADYLTPLIRQAATCTYPPSLSPLSWMTCLKQTDKWATEKTLQYFAVMNVCDSCFCFRGNSDIAHQCQRELDRWCLKLVVSWRVLPGCLCLFGMATRVCMGGDYDVGYWKMSFPLKLLSRFQVWVHRPFRWWRAGNSAVRALAYSCGWSD